MGAETPAGAPAAAQIPGGAAQARGEADGAAAPAFTREECRALRMLRDRYRHDPDLFTARERAHLRFLRWLHQAGRLT